MQKIDDVRRCSFREIVSDKVIDRSSDSETTQRPIERRIRSRCD